MLSAFLFVVPIHLATVLFAVVAADPQVIARKLRVALRLSFLIGIPGMIVLAAGAHFLLSLFGPGYASEATVPLVLLAIGYPLTVPKALYVAVCRASGKITRAATVLTTFSVAELGAAAAGAVWDGLIGLSLTLLAVRFVEALLVIPTVGGAAIGHAGRHRRPATGPDAAAKRPSWRHRRLPGGSGPPDDRDWSLGPAAGRRACGRRLQPHNFWYSAEARGF